MKIKVFFHMIKQRTVRLRTLFLVGLVLLLAISAVSKVSFSYEPADVYYPNEQLVYKVKYLFLRVGTLRMINEGLVDYNNSKYFRLKIFIDSASGIPFVNIHDVYISYVDRNSVPVAFFAWEKKGDYTLETDYLFDNQNKRVSVEIREAYPDSTRLVEKKQVPINGIYRDVLSLLFFARQKSGEDYKNITIPTFVLAGQDSCYFNEIGSTRELKFKGEKYPVYYLQGRVKFIGIAGIKDDFEGWFSVDAQRIPLKAKMKAFFGSITLELEHAENWRAGSSIFN
ncbi:MAG: hypothetical protein Kow0042_11100 [Calditrichia bacterium]